jgi:hypothetical protein
MNDVTGEAEQPEYPEERRSPDDRVVMLSMAETGFHIYYRFAQSLETCQNPVLDTRYWAL